MSKDEIEKITALLEPFLEREKLSLYDVEVFRGGRKTIIRIFIDRDGGVSHNDCARVSKHLSTLLDVEELFPGSCTMEVSSPGITRELKKPHHFKKSLGRLVKISFRNSFDDPRQITGRLEAGEGETFKIKSIDNGSLFEFSFNDVAKARLVFEQ